MTGRRVSSASACVAVALSVCAAGYSWLIGGLNCDDVCNGPASGWTGVKDAPQWVVIIALGVALLVLAVVLWHAVTSGRTRLGWSTAGLWTACGIPLAVLLTDAAGNTNTFRNLLLVGIASVLGAALYAERAGGHDRPRRLPR